jgi:phospholipid N-methyltransferase
MHYLWLRIESLWLLIYPKNNYLQGVKHAIQKNLQQGESIFTFLKVVVLNPRSTGAVLPSSKYLAQTIASHVHLSEQSILVELGAGTGAITKALLATGIPPQKMIAVEYAPSLAKNLREHFPEINILEGDAALLSDLLQREERSVEMIVSSLPLRSIPKETRQAIFSQISKVLSPQGQYIQFTYDLRTQDHYYPSHYQLKKSFIVWLNIPPARVEIFSMHPTD